MTDDASRLMQWVMWRSNIAAAPNEDVARALLTMGPHFGKLSDLIEIAAERLAPGVIDRMAEEQAAREMAVAAAARLKAGGA